MRKLLFFAAALLAAALPAHAQQERIASDFEVAQIERQLERSRDFLGQLSARLNLGDLRTARSERALARAEYQRALGLAATERRESREASDLARYATATSYAALAHAKLGHAAEAFELLEESIRVAGDNAKSWNIYSSSMTILGRSAKAVATARNAVRIAARELAADNSFDRRLDHAVYQHALASALVSAGQRDEAERELRALAESLRSREFDAVRREAAKRESFEIFSTARGDVAAYISLHNRTHLRLAALYEERGSRDLAVTEYERVLEARSDDATALTALARLAQSPAERERRYAEAFDANPFAWPLIRDYRARFGGTVVERAEATSAGAKMRRALGLLERGERRASREQFDELLVRFPSNETLLALRDETNRANKSSASLVPSPSPAAAELRALIDAFVGERLPAADRVALDTATFTSTARFDAAHPGTAGQTVLQSGTIEGVPFHFSQPTAFAGSFDPTQPLRLAYRILGVARDGDSDLLLLEPLKLEVAP